MARNKSLDRLTPRKRAFVEARVSGKNVKDSAAEVGISKRQGTKYECSEDVQKAFMSLMRKAIPEKKMVELIKGGCFATMPEYDRNGRKRRERPDWKTRKPYIDMAREDAGYVERKGSEGGGQTISVTVQHIGVGQPVVSSKPVLQITAETIPASEPVRELGS